ncbi:SEC5 [[Candida] subhashii]|uniref:Exocyst complex component SEC5 n=1 Tax=[Candida] subhashii TaxID=561895 RepID=A0A8J5QSX0_9ASCO|nr:SEC5 [[Candida] subhashii]KAG7662140.1 SEC5 [[Candida] subhashii]
MNRDIDDACLMSFYGVKTLTPKKLSHLNITEIDYPDIDEISKLSVEEQFTILNQLVNPNQQEKVNLNLTDRDVEDPLKGQGTNVVMDLIQKGIITSPRDPTVKSYLIGSQSFNSQKYLTTIHHDTPIQQLNFSLNFLEDNIHSHTNELKGAIDQNFIRFINCKKAIDDVLVEFKNSKTKAQKERDNARVFNPEKHAIRATTGKGELGLVQELEGAINNMNTTTSLMIRPISDKKNKEIKLYNMINFIKENKFFFDLPGILINSLSNHNNEKLIDDYNEFLIQKRKFFENLESQQNANLIKFTKEKNEEAIKEWEQEKQIKITILSKVFKEIDEIRGQFSKRTYKELLTLDNDALSDTFKENSKFISLIDNLSKLNPSTQTNPISEFLAKQIDTISKNFEYKVSKFDNKFLLMQSKLLDYINSLNKNRQSGSHINYISEKYKNYRDEVTDAKTSDERITIIQEAFGNSDSLDLPLVNETWLVLYNFIDFLDHLLLNNLNKCLSNYQYYAKQRGIDPECKIRDSIIDLINKVVLLLATLFDDDESNNSNNQLESSPRFYKQFVPYYTNSLSAIYHLTKINTKLNRIFTSFGQNVGTIGNLTKYPDTNKTLKSLKSYSSKINQKIIEAICAVWVNDCSQFYDIEDWKTEEEIALHTINDSVAKYTKFVSIIEYYQMYVIINIAGLIFQKEKQQDQQSEFKIVSAHPSKRILVSIEIQFMRSLNILVDSVMKKYNIERSLVPQNMLEENCDVEIFKILTVNNLDRLSSQIFPRLIRKFDQLYLKDLQKQNLKLFADIDKANITIIDDILTNEKLYINTQINNFFNTKFEPKELRIDGFIYKILVHFVKLINKIKPLTALAIFVKIINELQLSLIKTILDNLRKFEISSIALVNLKLDATFLLKVFDNSRNLKLNENCSKIIQILLNTIDEQYEQFGKNAFSYSQEQFQLVLQDNLNSSSSEFSCF